jgi:hypothetical protein
MTEPFDGTPPSSHPTLDHDRRSGAGGRSAFLIGAGAVGLPHASTFDSRRYAPEFDPESARMLTIQKQLSKLNIDPPAHLILPVKNIRIFYEYYA